MAGIQIGYGIEINPSAAKSFTRNHKGAKVLQGDIKDIAPSKLKEGDDPKKIPNKYWGNKRMAFMLVKLNNLENVVNRV